MPSHKARARSRVASHKARTRGEPKKSDRVERKLRVRAHFSTNHDQQVLTFGEWCLLNSISPKTGRRISKAPGGPVVTQLTTKRIGITVAADREWKARHARAVA